VTFPAIDLEGAVLLEEEVAGYVRLGAHAADGYAATTKGPAALVGGDGELHGTESRLTLT
jgi:hypothetical protein